MCLTAIAVALIAAFVAWPRRHNPTVRWMIALSALVAWDMTFYGLQSLALSDLPTYITLLKLEYVGLVFMPLAWLGMVLTFITPTFTFTHRQLALLIIIPLLILLLVFTNEWHGLVWQETAFTTFSSVPVFTPTYGIGFALGVTYTYSAIMIGTFYIIRSVRIRWRLYRTQAALLLIGAFFPWLRSLLLIFDDFMPFAGIAYDALLVAVGLSATAIAVLRVGLFSFAPFAYQTIFNLLPLGAILLDRDNYILAVNQEVVMFLEQPRVDVEGRHISEIFPEAAEWVRQLPSSEPLFDQLYIQDRTMEVNTIPIRNEGGHLIGTLIQARDITGEVNRERERQRAEQTARIIYEITRALSDTLSTDEVMQRLLIALPRLVDHDASNVMLYDPATRTARVRYAQGYSAQDEEWLRSITFSLDEYHTLATAAATKKPVIITDVRTFTGWVHHEPTRPVRGFACAPILVDDEVIGFFNIDVFREGALSPEIANRLELAAQQAGAAFRNAQMYERAQQQAEELKRRVDSLEILQKMARDISATVNCEELAAIALEAMLRVAQTRGGCIALMRDDQLQYSAYYGYYDTNALNAFLNDPAGLRAQLDYIEQVHITQDVHLVSAMSGSQLRITLPLRYTDDDSTRLLGVVLMEDNKRTLPVADRLEMLTVLADRLSVALQNAALIQQVSTRASELERVNAQLQELEELKTEMLRVAAHDLKTPLNVILNYASLLPDLVRQSQNLDHVYRDIRSAAERMDRIIRDFLSLERIGRLVTQEAPQVFAVHTLFDKLEVDYFMLAYRHQLMLETHIEAPPLYGLGDPVLVYEALSNLVSNAVKYTQAGGRIRVEAAIVNERLRFSVIDNGPGIPDDEHPNLFMPFYRTRAAQESKVDGTGLGLHLTKKIVERQRGQVFFTSVVGQGSTFGFDLPLPPMPST
ncbi:MAG: histidine kinase N-terminal 7TM domain-containing protein [Anaerolineae bacterium]